MLSKDDLIWLLLELPSDLTGIICHYFPQCPFIMPDEILQDYDWPKQCKITFGKTLSNATLQIYYNLCKRHTNDTNTIAVTNRDIFVLNNNKSYKYMHQQDSWELCAPAIFKISNCITDTLAMITDVGKVLIYDKQHGEFNLSDVSEIIQIARYDTSLMVLLNNGEVIQYDLQQFKKFRYTYPSKATHISANKFHALVLTEDGSVYTYGNESHGKLGYNTILSEHIQNKNRLTYLPSDIINIACGRQHSLLLRENGTIMSCGHNAYGQLGHDNNISTNTFTEVPGINNIVYVACGNKYSIIMQADGTLLACGDNVNGQLGFSHNDIYNKFTEIEGIPKNITHITCGYDTTVIKLSDDTFMATGHIYPYFSYQFVPLKNLTT